jgi:Protein of unknown function (DUF3168)
MSAGGALQASLAAMLGGIEGLTGVFDGPPARSPFPYAVVDAGNESDWAHKTGDGREVAVAITVWDEQPARLRELADAVEVGVGSLAPVSGWQLVTLRLVRRKIVRDVAGPWAAAIDYRARLLAS